MIRLVEQLSDPPVGVDAPDGKPGVLIRLAGRQPDGLGQRHRVAVLAREEIECGPDLLGVDLHPAIMQPHDRRVLLGERLEFLDAQRRLPRGDLPSIVDETLQPEERTLHVGIEFRLVGRIDLETHSHQMVVDPPPVGNDDPEPRFLEQRPVLLEEPTGFGRAHLDAARSGLVQQRFERGIQPRGTAEFTDEQFPGVQIRIAAQSLHFGRLLPDVVRFEKFGGMIAGLQSNSNAPDRR